MTGPARRAAPAAPVARVATEVDRAGLAALRTRVFVEEQGVPPEIERDERDATAVHVVSLGLPGDGALAGRVAATGRLLVDGRRATIGRMAADAAVRGRGHGAAVLGELHRQAVLRGVAEIELHAQVAARRFYERAGYVAVGDEYLEAGIRHVTMRRSLEPDAGPPDAGPRHAGPPDAGSPDAGPRDAGPPAAPTAPAAPAAPAARP